MRHLFIINPAAGKHMDVERVRSKISEIMTAHSDTWEIAVTKGPGDAETITRTAAVSSPEELRVYAIGGDGTLNEVVNGAAGFPHVAVACCPMGSGNDFVKLFNIGGEKLRDLRELVNAGERTLDLIECNGRYSINICSVGLDARIGLGMVKYKNYPLVTGKGAYLISLLVNVIQGIHRPYELEVDGVPCSGNYTLICACNGRWYGSSFNPSPDALPDDGLLDFLVVDQVSRLKVASLVMKYAKGMAKNYPELIHIYRGKQLKVRCDRMSMINIDGERLDADSLSFTLSANKIRFLVPEGAAWSVPNS